MVNDGENHQATNVLTTPTFPLVAQVPQSKLRGSLGGGWQSWATIGFGGHQLLGNIY